MGFPGGSVGIESACNEGDPGSTSGWEDPLEKGMAPIPVFLPGEFHGQRSLVGYSPWGYKESAMTEQLTVSLFKAKIPRNDCSFFVYLMDLFWL